MTITFHTSCAGIAGDPDKLLYGEVNVEGNIIQEFTLYNTSSWFPSFTYRMAQRRIIRKIRRRVYEL